MRIETLEAVEGFSQLAEEYDELHMRSSACENPCSRHEWLYSWWLAYGNGHRLHILTCRDDTGRLVGVLPGYITRTGVPMTRRFRLLADEHVGSTGLGPIADSSVGDAASDALAAHLCATTGQWDVADLRFLGSKSTFFLNGTRVPEGGSKRVRLDTGVTPVIALADDFERQLTEGISKRVRAHIRRVRRRTEEHGARFELVTGGDALPAALVDSKRLFEDRMHQVVGRFFRVTPQFAQFAKRMSSVLAEQGRLRIAFLTIGEERVAFAYLFRLGTTMHAVQCGFAEDWGWLNVFRALVSRVIEVAIDEGCTCLNFGLGDQAYKYEWGHVESECFSDVRVYTDSFAARAARLRDGFMDGALDAVLAAPKPVRESLLRTARHAKALLSRTKAAQNPKPKG